LKADNCLVQTIEQTKEITIKIGIQSSQQSTRAFELALMTCYKADFGLARTEEKAAQTQCKGNASPK